MENIIELLASEGEIGLRAPNSKPAGFLESPSNTTFAYQAFLEQVIESCRIH